MSAVSSPDDNDGGVSEDFDLRFATKEQIEQIIKEANELEESAKKATNALRDLKGAAQDIKAEEEDDRGGIFGREDTEKPDDKYDQLPIDVKKPDVYNQSPIDTEKQVGYEQPPTDVLPKVENVIREQTDIVSEKLEEHEKQTDLEQQTPDSKYKQPPDLEPKTPIEYNQPANLEHEQPAEPKQPPSETGDNLSDADKQTIEKIIDAKDRERERKVLPSGSERMVTFERAKQIGGAVPSISGSNRAPVDRESDWEQMKEDIEELKAHRIRARTQRDDLRKELAEQKAHVKMIRGKLNDFAGAEADLMSIVKNPVGFMKNKALMMLGRAGIIGMIIAFSIQMIEKAAKEIMEGIKDMYRPGGIYDVRKDVLDTVAQIQSLDHMIKVEQGQVFFSDANSEVIRQGVTFGSNTREFVNGHKQYLQTHDNI